MNVLNDRVNVIKKYLIFIIIRSSNIYFGPMIQTKTQTVCSHKNAYMARMVFDLIRHSLTEGKETSQHANSTAIARGVSH